jgi:hypothetical protein
MCRRRDSKEFVISYVNLSFSLDGSRLFPGGAAGTGKIS